MAKSMPIETKLLLSKFFPPGISEIIFSRYRIQAVPSASTASQEVILHFIDSFEGQVGGSNPEEEANIICNLISVLLNTRVRREGLRVNNVNIPVTKEGERVLYPQLFGNLDHARLNEYFRKILSLDIDLARQLVRACRAYSFALGFIPSDPTFAFFLLVVAGECLSSQDKVIPSSELKIDSQKCDRFCRFIVSFLPEEYKGEDERDEELFDELLRTAYYSHRSGFVHGGKEVSSASLMADKAHSSYFKHATEGKEVKTPGLGWFAKVIRGAILGYLDSLPSHDADEELLPRLALEKAMLKIKARKDIQKGQVVTKDDIEYR